MDMDFSKLVNGAFSSPSFHYSEDFQILGPNRANFDCILAYEGHLVLRESIAINEPNSISVDICHCRERFLGMIILNAMDNLMAIRKQVVNRKKIES